MRPMRSATRTALGVAALVAVGAVVPAGAGLLEDVTHMADGQMRRASSGLFDPESNADCHHVEPGQNLLLADLQGPGEIRHVWFTLASRDRRYPRTMVLRCYWDDAAEPSVETPIGDFFAAGNGMRANVESIPVSVSSYGRALNCYWRMPFRRHAVIEIENQGKERVSVYFQAEWLQREPLPDDALYFHARYRQEYPAKPLSPYTLFEGTGEGQYVGTVYSSQNTVGSWFGEADDRFYIDGETTPSIVGTGTEDYFNDAWNLRVHTYGRVGVPICETKGEERRITCYRWHLDDAVTFHRSLKVEIERRSFVYVIDPATGRAVQYDFKYRPDYVSSVAFWYQREPAEGLWPLAGVAERVMPEIWVEPTALVEQARVCPGLVPRRASNRCCNLKQFLYLRNESPGGWIELPFDVRANQGGRYAASVFQSLFREYGVWRVSLLGPEGELVLDPGLDFYDMLASREENYPENYHHGTTVETKLGEVHLVPGEHHVRFECVGTNPLSRHPETGAFGQGYSLGLDAVCLRRMPLEPAEWLAEYLPAEEALFAEMADGARATVEALAKAAEAYRAAHGRYPRSLEEVVADAGLPEGEPLDPWGQPYQYRALGVVRPWGADVWSWHGDSRRAVGWIGNWPTPLDLAEVAPAGAIVVEGESLTQTGGSPGVGATAQRVGASVNAPLSGEGLLFLSTARRDAWAELALPPTVPAGTYNAYLFLGTSCDYGVVRATLAGATLCDGLDGYTERIGMASAGPVRVTLPAGGATLRVQAAGKNARSAGYRMGVDALVLVPAR
jgi:hypothetical protein